MMDDKASNKIFFQFGPISIEGILNDSPTARAIWENLPIESVVNLWGNEIYFEIPVASNLDNNPITDIEKGYICYWPMAKAICIFFGPTPLSKGHEIVPACPVNFIGNIIGDSELLKKVEEREIVKIIRIIN
jgi:hypothetical protein